MIKNASKLKKGDHLSRISFMKIEGGSVQRGGFHVSNEDGFQWSIGTNVIKKECNSTHYDEEVKVSKTVLAETLMSARDAIIKVVFDKADGTERTLTGYVIGAEVVLGRTIAIDLNQEKKIKKNKEGDEYDTRQRLVDHRTLKSLIYKNVKYVLKGKK